MPPHQSSRAEELTFWGFWGSFGKPDFPRKLSDFILGNFRIVEPEAGGEKGAVERLQALEHVHKVLLAVEQPEVEGGHHLAPLVAVR
eukprot:1182554-Prorocentrum_minimum.AAC.2